MTLDKNGTTIQAGDIVEIKGAFFKNDNGFWYVDQDSTNPAYTGTGLTLHKIGKTGKISTSKGRIAFWPLFCCTSNRAKNAEANDWNTEHATIEITNKVNNAQVVEAFQKLVAEYKEAAEYYEMRGYGEAWIKPNMDNAEYYGKALERMGA